MFNPELKIFVDQDKCNGCGSCVEACPGEVYELRQGKATLDGCHCCRTCEDVCELDACHILENG